MARGLLSEHKTNSITNQSVKSSRESVMGQICMFQQQVRTESMLWGHNSGSVSLDLSDLAESFACKEKLKAKTNLVDLTRKWSIFPSNLNCLCVLWSTDTPVKWMWLGIRFWDTLTDTLTKNCALSCLSFQTPAGENKQILNVAIKTCSAVKLHYIFETDYDLNLLRDHSAVRL